MAITKYQYYVNSYQKVIIVLMNSKNSMFYYLFIFQSFFYYLSSNIHCLSFLWRLSLTFENLSISADPSLYFTLMHLGYILRSALGSHDRNFSSLSWIYVIRFFALFGSLRLPFYACLHVCQGQFFQLSQRWWEVSPFSLKSFCMSFYQTRDGPKFLWFHG